MEINDKEFVKKVTEETIFDIELTKLAKCCIELEYDGESIRLCFDDTFIRKLAQRVDEIGAGNKLADKFSGKRR